MIKTELAVVLLEMVSKMAILDTTLTLVQTIRNPLKNTFYNGALQCSWCNYQLILFGGKV